MSKAQQYIAHGDACIEMAEQTNGEAQRIMLLHIAETWLRLAEDESEPVTLH